MRAMLLLFLLINWIHPAFADDPKPVKILAKWYGKEKKIALNINVIDQISEKQKKLINSGFSTYSQLKIIRPRTPLTDERVLFKSQCTVKFDTWEEHYDLASLNENFKTMEFKEFGTYVEKCLTANIVDHTIYGQFHQNGGLVTAILQLNQISQDKSEKIREWLINQQSGVMQGLFSHMLGDLKLSEKISVEVYIPPFAEAGQTSKKVNILFPEETIWIQR